VCKPFPVNNMSKLIFYNYVQTEMTIYTNDSDDEGNTVLAHIKMSRVTQSIMSNSHPHPLHTTSS